MCWIYIAFICVTNCEFNLRQHAWDSTRSRIPLWGKLGCRPYHALRVSYRKLYGLYSHFIGYLSSGLLPFCKEEIEELLRWTWVMIIKTALLHYINNHIITAILNDLFFKVELIKRIKTDFCDRYLNFWWDDCSLILSFLYSLCTLTLFLNIKSFTIKNYNLSHDIVYRLLNYTVRGI